MRSSCYLSAYTHLYTQTQTDRHAYTHTNTHTTHTIHFHILCKFDTDGWLHPGILQAPSYLYPLTSTCSPVVISSCIGWSRWRPYGMQDSITVQNRISLRIILLFLIIFPDNSQNFYDICMNQFPVFSFHVPMFTYCLYHKCGCTSMCVYVISFFYYLCSFCLVLLDEQCDSMTLHREFRIRATSDSWSPLP